MARRALTTTAAALTTAATLLLTACGGEADSSSDDIKGADTGSSSSPPASASTPSGPSGTERPEITLPSSFQLTFENWTSSDPDEQAVLDDGREQLRAGYAAITANDPDSEALVFYHTEGGLSQAQRWIRTYTDKNLTVMGKLPVFDSEVTLGDNKKVAVLAYCTDESKAYSKDRKTGKVEGNPAGTDPEVHYSISLAKNTAGVWQTVSARSERGGCSK